MELTKTQIGGIMTLIILLSSGATYYIQDLGERTACRAGWELVMTGDMQGYYSCTTSTGVRYELCYEVTNTANTQNYWCQKGKLVQIPVEVPQSVNSTNDINIKYMCNQIECVRI